MFDRICRENSITHRLAKPRSPINAGKVERFHQTLQRELLDDVGVWSGPDKVQEAIDAFRHEYNTQRPHQSLGMPFPADRFAAASTGEQLPLRLPPSLAITIPARRQPLPAPPPSTGQPVVPPTPLATGDDVGLALEVTRLVPASDNLTVCGQQFWLSPTRAGLPVTFRADTSVVHLLIDGVRFKTVPSRLTPDHLRQLLAEDGVPAGPPPITTSPARAGAQIEVERLVNVTGLIGLAGRQHPVGYPFVGRRVTVRLDRGLMQITAAGVLLHSLPNPSPPPRSPASAMPAPPDLHRSPQPSRCGSNAASAAEGPWSLLASARRHRPGRSNPDRRSRGHHLPRLGRRPAGHRSAPHHRRARRPVHGAQARAIPAAHQPSRPYANLTTMHTQTRIPLLCSYDSDADAAYIYLDHPIPPAAAQRVIPFDPDQGMFNLDLNPEGHVIGLEILGARKRLPPALLQAIMNSQDQTNNKT